MTTSHLGLVLLTGAAVVLVAIVVARVAGLSYDRARALIMACTGLSLHQLCHIAATRQLRARHRRYRDHDQDLPCSIRAGARATRPGLAAITQATALLDLPHCRS